MNSVFTFNHLPVSSVPWYDTSLTFVNDMQRYNLEYFLMLSTVFDFFVPLAVATGYLFELQGVKGGRWIMLGYLLWDGVLQLKFVFRIIQIVTCSSWQICRNEDPAGNPNDLSLVFKWTFFGNLAWIIILMVYIAIAIFIKYSVPKEKDNILKEGLDERGFTLIQIMKIKEAAKYQSYVEDREKNIKQQYKFPSKQNQNTFKRGQDNNQ